jgi:ubiquinol-cytochrome c reductase iron-sulfur subunit
VNSQITQRRLAHTDIQIPNFDSVRRNNVKNIKIPKRESAPTPQAFSYLLSAGKIYSLITVNKYIKFYTNFIDFDKCVTGIGVASAYTAKAFVTDMVVCLSASADVLAMAKIEIKLDAIPEGKNVVFKWRGKPLFIRHRFVLIYLKFIFS